MAEYRIASMPQEGAKESDNGPLQAGNMAMGNMVPVPTYMGNSRPLVRTLAFRVRTKAELNTNPNAASDIKVTNNARKNSNGSDKVRGTLNQNTAIIKMNTALSMPINAFQRDRPAMIQTSGAGVARTASSVPFQRSNWIEYPDEQRVFPTSPSFRRLGWRTG